MLLSCLFGGKQLDVKALNFDEPVLQRFTGRRTSIFNFMWPSIDYLFGDEERLVNSVVANK
jgi:hypothetical protein